MSEHIEIEFKNLLTKDEFSSMKSFLGFMSQDFKKQVNHYFDTTNFELKDQSCALRIREKSGKYELTLKQPAVTGLLETNQDLPASQALSIVKTGAIPPGPVSTAISKLKVNPAALTYFGSLTTERAEKEYKSGLIVLDHSTYLSAADFEIEYEVHDEKTGEDIFKGVF